MSKSTQASRQGSSPGTTSGSGDSVRRSGKEELRATLLKTYVLRVRSEHGEEAVRKVLSPGGIDARMIDNETGWVSITAARRALRGIAQLLGTDALRLRGEWAVHPEALGAHVRMLRSAEAPIDAYRYLAENVREATRVGEWELEDVAPKETPKAEIATVRLVYKPRDDEETEKLTVEAEKLFCAAREGELSSLTRIWGLGDAEVVHETCLAKGDPQCKYLVAWSVPRGERTSVVAAGAGLVVGGAALGVAGGPLAGVLGGLLAGGLAGAVAYVGEQKKRGEASRVFEKNRIAALERGLDLRGEATSQAQPGELSGTVLGGKYVIGRKIGSGGIGVVYSAEHKTLGHEVAVKVLRGAAARDGGEIARLKREAYIQVHVDHPNVARVMDLDQMPDGSIYVVMERLVGRSLADRLAREGVMPAEEAVPVFVGVCRALEAAHKKGVVHRDLKPGNVFLCDDGPAKVLDFGMSKLTTAESLTQAGYTLGTPEYMAPEQCIGANVVPQTDVYALGVLMYEALTGELPISSRNRRELLDLHQRQVPETMRKKRPDLDVPSELDDVVAHCLRKKIADRPASAAELERLLLAIPTERLAPRSRDTSVPVLSDPDSTNETVSVLRSEPPPRP